MSWAASMHSLLFVPGNRPDRFDKALATAADLVCVDLEDSVPTADKDEARRSTLSALAGTGAALAVRINSPMTAEGLLDILAIRESGQRPRLLFVPMVIDAGHVALVRSVLQLGERAIVPLIESAAGLRRAHRIAAEPGVAAMMFGGGDLAAELGVTLAWEPLLAARGQFILACAGRHLGMIDVPFTDLADERGLEEETARARQLGFTAKAAIHPKQVATINQVFQPSEADVEEARAAVAAFRAAGGQAIRHRGRLLEAPLVRHYEALLAQKEKDQHA